MAKKEAALAVVLGLSWTALVLDNAPGDAGQSTSQTLAPARRVVLLSVDANADWIVDRLREQGKAPAFSALARQGASADAMVSTFPSLTAPAHSALWTGAFGRVNGVNGNEVPALPFGEHTIIEERSGMLSTALSAEPIWITAARAGLRVLISQATGVFPFSSQYPDRLLLFDTYGNGLAPDAVVEDRLQGGRYDFLVGETSFALVPGSGGGLTLRTSGGDVALKPGLDGRFSPPVSVRAKDKQGSTRFRLISYAPDTGRFKLYRGAANVIVSNRPAELPAFRAATGAILGGGADVHYRQGAFGPTLDRGGNGEAERWFTEIVQTDHEYFDGILRYATLRQWNLLVLYVPSLDIASHALAGILDPASTKYSAVLAARVWPVFERLFLTTVDEHVAEIRRRFPDATLIVTGDHGMEGVGRRVFPNVSFRKAGLLAVDEKGAIDPARTKAVLLSSHTGQVFINTVDHKLGIVAQHEKADLKRQVMSILLGIRDPETGRAPIRAVFDPDVDGPALGIGGPTGGDLYFDPELGYSANVNPRGEPEVVVLEVPVGVHGPAPWRRNLLSVFYAVGPGVRPGRQLGIVRIVDIAPTLARLLGIPPPPDATGHALPLR